jgi:ABC-2 type transport system permease protein
MIRKDFLIFLSDTVALALGFIVPMVMILIFGLVFGGAADDGLKELEVLAVNQDVGPAGARLLAALNGLDEIRIIERSRRDSVLLDSTRARTLVETGKASVALMVPRDFSDQLRAGRIVLTTLEDPRDKITGGVVNGLLQQQLFSTFPAVLPLSLTRSTFGDSAAARTFNSDLRDILSKNYGVAAPESTFPRGLFPESWVLGERDTARGGAGFGFDSLLAQSIKIERTSVVGATIVSPGIAQSVAGPAVMFLLFAVGAIAASLLRELRSGTAQRLLSGRATPGELLCAKYGYAVLLGSVQLMAMMLYGKLIFGLNIFGQPAALLLVIVSAAAATSAVGLVTAALSRTEEQAAGMQVVIILGMSAIGGAMFPSFMIPEFVRTLAQITPVHWAMQGFLDLFWREQGVRGVALECGVLLGMALVLVTISVFLFRRRLALELG